MKDPFRALQPDDESSGPYETLLRAPDDLSSNPVMRQRDFAQRELDRIQERRVKMLEELTDKTNMPITQENGQRRYGPPPGTPAPLKGSEVFVGRIPRNYFEPHLVPVFEKVGRIYELRLMMDFSGSNRGYCFVQYYTPAEADRAIRELNNYEIRRGTRIGVVKSVDNCRLVFTHIPKDKDGENILAEIQKITEGVAKVTCYPPLDGDCKNRGFAFVEYDSHKMAAMARRKFLPGKIKLWGFDVAVDWAEPEPEGCILFVRNLNERATEESVKDIFDNVSCNGVQKVKIVRDFAFVTFKTAEQAEMAKVTLENCRVNGTQFSVHWAKSSGSGITRNYRNKVWINFNGPPDAGHNNLELMKSDGSFNSRFHCTYQQQAQMAKTTLDSTFRMPDGDPVEIQWAKSNEGKNWNFQSNYYTNPIPYPPYGFANQPRNIYGLYLENSYRSSRPPMNRSQHAEAPVNCVNW